MKIAVPRLRKMIREFMLKEQHGQGEMFEPTAGEEAKKVNAQAGTSYVTDQDFWEQQGIITGEDLARDLLASTYSDLHKGIHGTRPRHINFDSMSFRAIDALIQDTQEYYDDLRYREEFEVKQEREIAEKEKALAALMPGDYDYEHISKRSGMSRRTEGVLRQVIREAFLPNLPYAPMPMKSRASAIVLDAIKKSAYPRIKEGTHDDLYARFRDILIGAPDRVLDRRHKIDEVLAYVQGVDSGAADEFNLLSSQDQPVFIKRLQSLTDSIHMSKSYYQSEMYSGD